MMMTRTKVVLRGVLLAMAAACVTTITGTFGPRETQIKVGFYIGALPPGAQALGAESTVTLPGGSQIAVKLYDEDNDGTPDIGCTDEDNCWDGEFPDVRKQQQLMAGPGAIITPGGRVTAQPFTLEFVPYWNPTDEPMDFEFDPNKSDQDYLEEYGLAGFQPGVQLLDGRMLEVVGFDLEYDEANEVVTDSRLEVMLAWNTAFDWPVLITDFPLLQYEYKARAGGGTWPQFIMLHVEGPGGAVLGWLGEFGFQDLLFTSLELADTPLGDIVIDSAHVSIDQRAGLADITVDGETVTVKLL